MQAIILAAGEGTRMRPLTWTRAKPLLEVAGKSLIERNLDQLERAGCDSVVIVVGYKGEQIRQKLGEEFGRMKLSYAVQEERKGTGHALLQAQVEAEDRFLVLMGDDLYMAKDMEDCWNSGISMAAAEVKDPERFGVLAVNGDRVVDLVEKPAQPPSNMVNTALYCLDRRIFDLLRSANPSPRGEIELTDGVRALVKADHVRMIVSHGWRPVGYPWDILAVSEEIIKQELTEQEIDPTAQVSEKATITGPVKIGAGTVIKAGACIEGPVIIGRDCKVGPNCFIRHGAVLGNNVSIGNAVEVKNSIIGDGTHVDHLSYVGDSILGHNCSLGAGTITANLRHDNRSIRATMKEQLIDTGRRKMGMVMGDRCKTGIHTSVYPGTFLGPFSWTLPGTVVSQNLGPLMLWDGKEAKGLEPRKFEALIKDPAEFKALQEVWERSGG